MAYFVTPKQAIALSVFQLPPDVEELLDSVVSDMIGLSLALFPRKRDTKPEETHWISTRSGASPKATALLLAQRLL